MKNKLTVKLDFRGYLFLKDAQFRPQFIDRMAQTRFALC